MSETLAAISFPDKSVTYEAYSTIKNTADSFGVVSAVIVERRADGSIAVTEGESADAGAAVREAMRDQHQAEHKQRPEERVDALKAKFQG